MTRAWRGRLGLASPAHLLTATSGRPIKLCGVHIDRQGRVTIGTFVSRRALDGFSAAGVCVWLVMAARLSRVSTLHLRHMLHMSCMSSVCGSPRLLSNVVDYPANHTPSDQRPAPSAQYGGGEKERERGREESAHLHGPLSVCPARSQTHGSRI